MKIDVQKSKFEPIVMTLETREEAAIFAFLLGSVHYGKVIDGVQESYNILNYDTTSLMDFAYSQLHNKVLNTQ